MPSKMKLDTTSHPFSHLSDNHSLKVMTKFETEFDDTTNPTQSEHSENHQA